ncbi:polysaccharide lyase [Nakamurella deserti]|uniref:polysaccharide lyase n=1 Tax=Nakamurella deserti TaxID=2164074 RepID=UPI003B837531
MSIVSDGRGGKAVRTVLRAGTTHSLPTKTDNGNNLFIALPGSYDEACMSYDIRFDRDFDWSLGGKLPGLEGVAPGTSLAAPTGGNNTDKGWSGRLMWLGPKAYKWAGPLNMAVSYMYHPGQAGTYGDNVRWNTAFVAGQWHTVKQCHSMNTVGKADGVLRAWIDGKLVVDDTSYVYRVRNDVHISHIVFSIFRGGNTLDWAGSRDNFIDIDNIAITSS